MTIDIAVKCIQNSLPSEILRNIEKAKVDENASELTIDDFSVWRLTNVERKMAILIKRSNIKNDISVEDWIKKQREFLAQRNKNCDLDLWQAYVVIDDSRVEYMIDANSNIYISSRFKLNGQKGQV